MLYVSALEPFMVSTLINWVRSRSKNCSFDVCFGFWKLCNNSSFKYSTFWL